jgi:hypothetical protein
MLCIPLWPFITGCVLLFCVIVALLTLYFASSLCKVKLPRPRLAVKRKRSSSTGQVMSLDGTNPSSTATAVLTSTDGEGFDGAASVEPRESVGRG